MRKNYIIYLKVGRSLELYVTVIRGLVQTTWTEYYAILSPSPSYVDTFTKYLVLSIVVIWATPSFVHVVCTCPLPNLLIDFGQQSNI